MTSLTDGGTTGLFRSRIKISFVAVVGFEDGRTTLPFTDHDVCVCDGICIRYNMPQIGR